MATITAAIVVTLTETGEFNNRPVVHKTTLLGLTAWLDLQIRNADHTHIVSATGSTRIDVTSHTGITNTIQLDYAPEHDAPVEAVIAQMNR